MLLDLNINLILVKHPAKVVNIIFKTMGEAEEGVGPFVEIMRDNSLRTIKG
jgi:hypothetical protein